MTEKTLPYFFNISLLTQKYMLSYPYICYHNSVYISLLLSLTHGTVTFTCMFPLLAFEISEIRDYFLLIFNFLLLSTVLVCTE